MNSIKLAKEIEERSGVDPADMPRLAHFVWFSVMNGGPTLFTVGQPLPFKKATVVYAMFQNDEVVRVYVLATAQEDDKSAAPPSRYTFSKQAPTYSVEVMTLEVFMDEIADEWQAAAGLNDDDDDDESEIDADEMPETVNGKPVAHEVVGAQIEGQK
jgi:hypothetical protein